MKTLAIASSSRSSCIRLAATSRVRRSVTRVTVSPGCTARQVRTALRAPVVNSWFSGTPANGSRISCITLSICVFCPLPGLQSIAKALERSFHRQSCLGGREWRPRRSSPEWLLLPDVSPRRLAVAAGIADDQVGHGLEHPVEVVCGDREAVEVGRGVQEVDGVRDAIANSELDGIHVIAERLHQFPGIADH